MYSLPTLLESILRIYASKGLCPSFAVLVAQPVAVNRVGTEMLMLEVMVESYQLFPFNHGHCRVEGIEVSHLDISEVVVVLIGLQNWDSPLHMIRFFLCARRHGNDSVDCAVDQLKPHAHVDEGHPPFL